MTTPPSSGIPAMAAAGGNIIVEHVVEFACWRTELDDLLDGFAVFWVAVHRDSAEIDRREMVRGDAAGATVELTSRTPASTTTAITTSTTAGVTNILAHSVIDEWRCRSPSAGRHRAQTGFRR